MRGMMACDMSRRVGVGAMALVAALAGGCAGIDNSRVVVGGEEPPALVAPSEGGDETLVEAAEPSLDGLDRGHWASVDVEVKPDGTQHAPRLTTNGPRYADRPSRNRGLHPTVRTALDLESDGFGQWSEALAAPFHAGADVVLALPRMMIGLLRGGVVASPAERYQRFTPSDGPTIEPERAPIEPDQSDETRP